MLGKEGEDGEGKTCVIGVVEDVGDEGWEDDDEDPKAVTGWSGVGKAKTEMEKSLEGEGMVGEFDTRDRCG